MIETNIDIEHLQLLDNSIAWKINRGEINVVIGGNGSGKSQLAKIVCGKQFHFNGTIHWNINFTDISYSDYTADSSRFHYSNYYYQQRYNTSDIPEMETIQDYLSYDDSDAYQKMLFEKVLSPAILSKNIIALSSGESRKVLLLKNLFKPCKVFVLDNPFTGLDADSIAVMNEVFTILAKLYKKTVILLLNAMLPQIESDFVIQLNQLPKSKAVRNSSLSINFFESPKSDFEIAFQIKNKDIKVANNLLIENISWTIRKGEKWILKGANGSGKSTLMSLLNADNPMAYGLGITLFDKPRGSGESIWEIKSKIGFVSPELQMYWDGAKSVKAIVRSGFSNTQFLNRKLTTKEDQRYLSLMESLQLLSIENEMYASLSSGEKKMVMLVRALVNNPPVLILDEPFQGLDDEYFKLLYDFLAVFADAQRTVIQIAHIERELLLCINRTATIENSELIIG